MPWMRSGPNLTIFRRRSLKSFQSLDHWKVRLIGCPIRQMRTDWQLRPATQTRTRRLRTHSTLNWTWWWRDLGSSSRFCGLAAIDAEMFISMLERYWIERYGTTDGIIEHFHELLTEELMALRSASQLKINLTRCHPRFSQSLLKETKLAFCQPKMINPIGIIWLPIISVLDRISSDKPKLAIL